MKYFTDGFLRGSKNPSPFGGGFTIVDEAGNLIERQEIIREGFTNNEAEILGILHALRICDSGDTISTDSMCCLSWANSGFSKVRPDLREILEECKILKFTKKVNLMWEGRDFNLAGIYNEDVQYHFRRKNKEERDASRKNNFFQTQQDEEEERINHIRSIANETA